MSTVTETKDTGVNFDYSKLELETSCGLSFKAWTDAANEAGITLRPPHDLDSGGYPKNIYSNLRHFRRAISKSKGEPKKVITHIHRVLVSVRDENRKPTKKEYLWYTGHYEVKDHRGVPFQASLDVGRYQRPIVVPNSSQRYNPNTGEPTQPSKIFAGQETVYTIEVPKSKTERKKLIDDIIGDNFPEEIHYYYDSAPDEPLGRSDDTFTYDDFVNCTIEELKDMSQKAGGSKGSNYYRDNDGNLRSKDGQIVSRSNTAAYK